MNYKKTTNTIREKRCVSKIKIIFLAAVLIFNFQLLTFNCSAQQGVSINISGTPPDNSAMLDVNSVNKGLLIPRVALLSTTDVVTITTPAVSLLVFNTNNAMTGGAIGYWYWNGANWVQALGPQGPTGPTGPSGADGATGPQGTTGIAGSTGASGATGAQGSTGIAGSTGVTGPTGPSGADGSTGAVGATGPMGPTGLAGSTGANGATGPQGSTGIAGTTGANGATGPIGPTGANGSNGTTGPAGPTGANGATGATGNDLGTHWTITGNTGTTASTSAIGIAVNNNFIGTTDTKDWVLATNNLERMRIASGGNIGIGTIAPLTNLQIAGNNPSLMFSPSVSGGGGSYKSFKIQSIPGGGFGYLAISCVSDDNVNTFSGLTIDANGRVAIGYPWLNPIPFDLSFYVNAGAQITKTIGATTQIGGAGYPGAHLAISAGAPGNSADQTGGNLYLSSGSSRGNVGSQMEFKTATPGVAGLGVNTPSTKMIITPAGRVGIGLTNPSTTLHLKSTAITAAFIETSDNSGFNQAGLTLYGGCAGAAWSIFTNRSDLGGVNDNLTFYKEQGTIGIKMVLTDAGRLGIGTATPGAKLEVQGNVKIVDGTQGLNKVLTSDAVGLASWQAPSAGVDATAWHITGNAGTIDGINFIGTTDNIPFNIKVNNQKAGRIDNTLMNTFFGYQAGKSNTTGHSNTANGYQALYSDTSGFQNTAIGIQALYSNTSGYENTATGWQALDGNTTGNSNTANGFRALDGNTTGNANVAIGGAALMSNATGNYNVATGFWALAFSTGSQNTANGHAALYGNHGDNNTATGFQSLNSNTANGNTANGALALKLNTTGYSNVAIGTNALYSNTNRNNLVAMGDSALFNNGVGASAPIDASANTAVGSKALFSNTIGFGNTANGYQSLYMNTTGTQNTAVGYQAGYSNTVAGINGGSVAVGYRALYSNSIWNNNTAIGYKALYSLTFGANTAVGSMALNTCNMCTGNTAIGINALLSADNSYYNTATGLDALGYTTTGCNNTANGYFSLLYNTTGSDNTALGYWAGHGASGVSFNQCTFIGDNSYPNVARSNVTMLGYGITNGECTNDNQVLLGNTTVTQIRAAITGITAYSDARFKTNIKDNVVGLNFILKLKPVTYNVHPKELHKIWGTPDSLVNKMDFSDAEKETRIGFVAQDVEKAAKECGFNFPGIDVPKNDKEVYSLRYVDFIMPMVKAVQELNDSLKLENAKQQTANDKQQIMIDDLKKKNEELSKQIPSLMSEMELLKKEMQELKEK